MFENLATRSKKLAAAGLLALAVTAGTASAQAAAIDVSGPTGTIASGLVAVAAIGAAWIGYRYLKKVWASL
jgi:hypothetical protein